jgi:hypothetical protein
MFYQTFITKCKSFNIDTFYQLNFISTKFDSLVIDPLSSEPEVLKT